MFKCIEQTNFACDKYRFDDTVYGLYKATLY